MSARRITRAVVVAAILFVPVPVLAAGAAAETVVTAGHPSADLDQCRNGSFHAPVRCADRAWVNGNANAIHAHYVEGDSIAYRMRFENIDIGPHTVRIEWDSTERGKHALDYLTTYDRTDPADPCTDVAGCGGRTLHAIPPAPAVSGAGGTQVPGSFSLCTDTITCIATHS